MMARIAGVLAMILALVIVAYLMLTVPLHAQSFEMARSHWPLLQAREASGAMPVTLRITASRQPVATLRAVSREKLPEGAALYAVRACNVSAAPMVVDAGLIEQALEGKGIAVSTRMLAQLTTERSRNRGLSWIGRFSGLLSGVDIAALGAAASGAIKIRGWEAAAMSGALAAIRLIADAGKPELDATRESITSLGPLLADAGRAQLYPGECSPRLLLLGSYRAGQPATVTIEE